MGAKLVPVAALLAISLSVPPTAGSQAGRGGAVGMEEVYRILLQAREVALSIESRDQRVQTLSMVASSQVLAGDVNGAFATPDALDSEDERAEVLWSVADAQALNGDFVAALATAHSLPDSPAARKPWLLLEIARRQAQAGDLTGAATTVEQARAAARGLDDPFARLDALGRIARLQRAMGDSIGAARTFDEAKEVAESAEGPQREHALSVWARLQAQMGKLEEATQTASEIQPGTARESAVVGVVARATEARRCSGSAQHCGRDGKRDRRGHGADEAGGEERERERFLGCHASCGRDPGCAAEA